MFKWSRQWQANELQHVQSNRLQEESSAMSTCQCEYTFTDYTCMVKTVYK